MQRVILHLSLFSLVMLSVVFKVGSAMGAAQDVVGLDPEIRQFLLADAKERFLRYVRIDTRSDPASKTHPSTKGQLELGRLLVEELEALELDRVTLDTFGYVYATLPARKSAADVPAITFCAHLDTSPSESGREVKPVIHEDYDGSVIQFANNDELTLDPKKVPELKKYLGENIITSSGDTLLGADDKAGIAEIMAALAAFRRFDNLPHPELRIVFTPDEEIGQGPANINVGRLGRYGYTVDGGGIGEIEDECFYARKAILTFKGHNIHPGYAKNKMVNAAAIASRFIASLPEKETPEHTEGREGFYHLVEIGGGVNQATITLLLRDFDGSINEKRAQLIRKTAKRYETQYNGLKIDVKIQDQYPNMVQVFKRHPQVVEKASLAIEAAGLKAVKVPIRGGTDGTAFSFMGMPTPNLFAGQMMFHSKSEWISEIALQKAAEVIVHLCRLWAVEG